MEVCCLVFVSWCLLISAHLAALYDGRSPTLCIWTGPVRAGSQWTSSSQLKFSVVAAKPLFLLSFLCYFLPDGCVLFPLFWRCPAQKGPAQHVSHSLSLFVMSHSAFAIINTQYTQCLRKHVQRKRMGKKLQSHGKPVHGTRSQCKPRSDSKASLPWSTAEVSSTRELIAYQEITWFTCPLFVQITFSTLTHDEYGSPGFNLPTY